MINIPNSNFAGSGGLPSPVILRANERAFLERIHDGNHHFIWGAPESGKSNLIAEAIKALPDQGHRCALVDLRELTIIGQIPKSGSLLNWYVSFCNAIAKALGIDIDNWQGRNPEGDYENKQPEEFFKDFVEDMLADDPSGCRATIFIDHIEILDEFSPQRTWIDSSLLKHGFFRVIQNHYERSQTENDENARDVQFIFAGAVLYDDFVSTLGEQLELDFIIPLGLKDFEMEDLQYREGEINHWQNKKGISTELVNHLFRKAQTQDKSKAHPYLVASIITLLHNENRSKRNIIRRLKQACKDYLEKIERFLDKASDKGVRDLYEQLKRGEDISCDPTNLEPNHTRLVNSGVATVSLGRLKIHNALFQEVITARASERERIPKPIRWFFLAVFSALSVVVLNFVTGGAIKLTQTTVVLIIAFAIVLGLIDASIRDSQGFIEFRSWLQTGVDHLVDLLDDGLLRKVRPLFDQRLFSRKVTLALFGGFVLLTFLSLLIFGPPAYGSHLDRKATETLFEFDRAELNEDRLGLLKDSLEYAKKSDILQSFTSKPILRRLYGQQEREGNIPLFVLHYIYDSIDESEIITDPRNVKAFSLFDVSDEGDIASVADIGDDRGLNSVVLFRGKKFARMLATNHTSSIEDIEFVPKGNFLLTASADTINASRINLDNSKPSLQSKRVRNNTISTVALSHEGSGPSRLFASTKEGDLLVWDVEISDDDFIFKDQALNQNIQSYENTPFLSIVRSSDQCLAVSGYLENANERLQVWPLKGIDEDNLENGFSADVEFRPTSLGIDKSSQFLAVGGRRDDGMYAITLVPLGVEDKPCKPLGKEYHETFTLNTEGSSESEDLSIVDIQISSGEKQMLLVMQKDGTPSAYEISVEKPTKESDPSYFEKKDLLNKRVAFNKGNSNDHRRVVPHPLDESKFYSSAGETGIWIWETSFIKNEEFLKSEALLEQFLDFDERPDVKQIAVTRSPMVRDNAYAVLSSGGNVKFVNDVFTSDKQSPYGNAGLVKVRNSVEDSPHYFAVNDREKGVLYIHKSLSNMDTKRTYRAGENVSSVAFNPASKNIFAFSVSDNISWAEELNSDSTEGSSISLDLDDGIRNIGELSFNHTGNMLSFLSNGHLVILDVTDPNMVNEIKPFSPDGDVYKNASFYVNPEETSDTSYVFAMLKGGKRIDILKVSPSESPKVKVIERVSFSEMKEEWRVLKENTNSTALDSDPWKSWAFDYKGKRLAIGATNEILIFDISNFSEKGAKLKKRLIALYQSKRNDWGKVRHLVFGHLPSDAKNDTSRTLTALTSEGKVISAHTGGQFDKLQDWSCKWIEGGPQQNEAQLSFNPLNSWSCH